jgi:parallel beta-helix repeat protein
MEEKQPGVYIGAYRIKARDRLAYGRMAGILRSQKGVGSQWIDTLGPVRIGKPTVLPPVISNDYALSIEKSPYLVTGALVVKPGVRLTLNPGTVIWFRSLGLIVKGQLEILGTRDDPVRLASLEEAGWKGIFLDRSSDENKINYCTISKAEYGFRASMSNVSIRNCQFHDNVWGIVMEESRGEISGSLIRTSAKLGIAARKAQILIKNSVITENSSGGILLEDSKAMIEQNNIQNNGSWAIKVLDQKARVRAANNWWGNADPAKKEIIGPVAFQPVLKSPIEFSITEF